MWYTPDEDAIQVAWSGYVDDESPIQEFTLGVYTATSCGAAPSTHTPFGTPVELDANETTYHFFNLGLDVRFIDDIDIIIKLICFKQDYYTISFYLISVVQL